jgi:hypothetical protein
MTGAMFTPSEGSGGFAGAWPGGRKTFGGSTPGWGAGAAARACSVRNSPVGVPSGAAGTSRLGTRGVGAAGLAGPPGAGAAAGRAPGAAGREPAGTGADAGRGTGVLSGAAPVGRAAPPPAAGGP